MRGVRFATLAPSLVFRNRVGREVGAVRRRSAGETRGDLVGEEAHGAQHVLLGDATDAHPAHDVAHARVAQQLELLYAAGRVVEHEVGAGLAGPVVVGELLRAEVGLVLLGELAQTIEAGQRARGDVARRDGVEASPFKGPTDSRWWTIGVARCTRAAMEP